VAVDCPGIWPLTIRGGRNGGKRVIAAAGGLGHDECMPHAVVIILYDGVQSIDVTGPLEVFAGANTYLRARGERPYYSLRTASVGAAAVVTSSGLRLLPDGDLDVVRPPDTLVVPGGEGSRAPAAGVLVNLSRLAPAASRVMSVCTGALLLAEIGLLDGRRATTHWAMCAAMAERYPAVQVDPEPIFVRDGALYTSAGVTAGIDLALALVEDDLGREPALLIARHLVMFLRRPGGQAQFSAQLRQQIAQRESLREVQQWIADRPASNLSVDSLATRAGMSTRHFARAFQAEIGITPGRYVSLARLESARRLLEDTTSSVDQIARSCGYGVTESMRRAFHRELGVSPAQYRQRF
jgi:transcriptional regulator GlxA family with amidase domain